jgi:hypothetical protein
MNTFVCIENTYPEVDFCLNKRKAFLHFYKNKNSIITFLKLIFKKWETTDSHISATTGCVYSSSLTTKIHWFSQFFANFGYIILDIPPHTLSPDESSSINALGLNLPSITLMPNSSENFSGLYFISCLNVELSN